MALWPSGVDWENLVAAWTEVHIDRFFLNTVVIALGAWLVQIVVATTAGYALSVLRPRYAQILTALVLATLFVPAVVLLVPLYLVILHPPIIGTSLINTFWAVWLPAGANAFTILLMKRFFDNLPRDIFDAARVDGAGPFRLFWSVVLPMSQADPGRRFGLRHHRDVEGLSLAATRSAGSCRPTALGAAADAPGRDRDSTCSSPRSSFRRSSRSRIFLIFQRLFLNSEGFEGAVKG